MRAVAVFPGSREVKLIETPEPARIEPDQVLVRMLDIGICGTDREICTFEYGRPPPGCDHLVIGHEAAAEVVDVGPEVLHLQPKDLVVPSVRRPCPHLSCPACQSNHQDYCYTGDFTERGIVGEHGFMTEYVVDRARYMSPVAASLRDIAVLTEPLTIAEKALEQIFWLMQVRPPFADPDTPRSARGDGLRALVLGLGPVGLLGAMALVTCGFETYVYSRELPPSDRTDLVAQLGANYLSTQECTFAELVSRTGNIDLIYEAVGHSHFALEALGSLGTNGLYVMTGVPGIQDLIQADPARIMRQMVLKNQVLLGTVNAGPEAFALALEDLGRFSQRWPDQTRSLIGGRYPPEETVDLVLGRPRGIKTVISFEA